MTARSTAVCSVDSKRVVQPLIDVDVFRDVVGRFATGITIVTTKDVQGQPAGFTCQAFMSLSISPPRILIVPGNESVTWTKIRESRTFCVNILGDSHEPIARRFARRDNHKFDAVDWTPAAYTGAPVLHVAAAWLDCELGDVFDLGDHCVAVGYVREAATVDSRAPLIYFRGGFMPPSQTQP
jgi:3-hydroxy-9,10-secoandrosta-1,3,5(10)-triene-9,17-dione monooxygenase reductase component